ncbi:MAG: hypothetical protein COS76_04560 [Candidatus Portnoybacteria bacterium CG06_land_8_20_14_3_00_39_12]|uniref:Nudix hydrolase domain-containing protein n=3 Tax=Candidatus Portnoyibacteriota TaxID=1817913 RepID=A0A2M8KGE9_9BACT|nr:MAG: hypothetical protein AUJ33_01850 [Parcubacteria group bacterium CG1_02_40_25]PIU74741.1 MAG: hypothetical protein COS76_04560 [Candidatus Portnoybacteria bacterium CG06_land_8_20_14_3_00_39_12]PIZ70436.1 MAG: hypothetical protein COY09_03025 [Candidatus Portnoybacteria bacterium CG_4_10_14_0_2_um_filter_39_11]PJE59006.1 MAG: hypothetical protein COU83_00675 [Candidatus Portnoybacteria bacterium CG10_big_fil_rev_8_21_14_0_10_40_22]
MEPQKDLYQISLKLILKNKQGEILLLRAPDVGGRFAGFYDLPGGRIHVDEFLTPFERCIEREVREEAGDVKFKIDSVPVAIVRDGPPILKDSEIGKRILYIFFQAEYLGGDVLISSEHVGYCWVDLAKENLERLFPPEFLKGIKMCLLQQKKIKK